MSWVQPETETEGRTPANHGWRAAQIGGKVVYAIGGVRGCYDLLLLLFKALARDRERLTDEARPILVFCGGYIDGGPDSARVIEALSTLERRSDYELRFLKGRSERALLDFLQEPEAAKDWIAAGGAQTLLSYGVTPPGDEEELSALADARDDLLTKMTAAHLRFLERLQPFVEIGDYGFVHAGVRPGRALRDQTEEDLLSGGPEFIAARGPFEKVIVHGDTWVDDRPRILQHRIGVDTGAHRTGVLTAVRISDNDIYTLQVRADGGPRQEPQ